MNPPVDPNRCSRCGGPLPADSQTRCCPGCALETMLQTNPDQENAGLSLHDIPPPGATVSYIGDYELLEVIAQGGMGAVYRARQRSLDRIVALKLLLGGQHASKDFKKRFRQEAETAAKLQHPSIVPIYEVGEHEGQPYFSMEYVPGPNLAQLAREQPLQPRKAAAYLQVIAEAIACAHQQSVVHRDIKPSNILLGPDDRPRVTDFGLARQMGADSSLTLTGEMLGTPGYLPPEQASIKKGKVGVHSDVYALGAVLYYLLTSRPPFMAGTLADTLRQVLSTEPAPPRQLNPAIPRDLETICLKCLEKEPHRRYASAADVAADLQRFLDRKPILAKRVTLPQRIIKWYHREPLVAGLATGIVIVLLLGLASSLFQWRRAERQRDAAQIARDEAKRNAHDAENARSALAALAEARNSQSQPAPNPAGKRPQRSGVPTLAVAKTQSNGVRWWQPAMGDGLAQMLITELSRLTNFKVLESVALGDLRAERVLGDVAATNSPEASAKGQWRGADYTLKTMITRFGWKNNGPDPGGTNESEVQIDWRIVDNLSREIAQGATGRAVGIEKGAQFDLSSWNGNAVNNREFMDSALAKATVKALAQIWEKVGTLNLPSHSGTTNLGPADSVTVAAQTGPATEDELKTAKTQLWTRTISPFTRLTLPEYLKGLVRESNAPSAFAGGQTPASDEARSHRISDNLRAFGLRTNNISEWESFIRTLTDDLTRRGDRGSSEQLLNAVLSPEILTQPQCVGLLRSRAALRARTQRWPEAANDLTMALQLDPTNHLTYHLLGPVLTQLDDAPAYQRFCAQVAQNFSGTTSPVIAERMAKASLLIPTPGLDLAAASALAGIAAAATNHSYISFFQLAEGLAEYRLGHYESATNWVARSLQSGSRTPDAYRDTESFMVLAMACSRLNQANEARSAFQKGTALAAALPSQTTDLGEAWNDWLVANLLIREAKAFIE